MEYCLIWDTFTNATDSHESLFNQTIIGCLWQSAN
ncbi:hypothetical protein SRB17_90180 [Streptomyces sp. RB17]|nr:hypothetical protein [Streptomyces sp. RB17]